MPKPWKPHPARISIEIECSDEREDSLDHYPYWVMRYTLWVDGEAVYTFDQRSDALADPMRQIYRWGEHFKRWCEDNTIDEILAKTSGLSEEQMAFLQRALEKEVGEE